MEHMAPKGVKLTRIGDVANVSAGATPSAGVAEYWENGSIPWMNSGEVNKGTVYDTDTKITQAGYDSCSTRMLPPNTVVVALAGQGKTRGLVARTRVALCTNQSLAAIVPNRSLDSDFLYYYLSTQYQNLREISSGDGTRGGLNLQLIRSYRVPIPPLEIQREIVRNLESFTELETELEAALQAELKARRKQYSYHRHALLTLSETDVPWTALGEVVTVLDSQRRPIKKTDRRPGPYPYYGANGIQDWVSDFLFEGTYLLMGEDGSVVNSDGSPVVNWAEGRIWVNNHAHVMAEIPSRASLRFVYHYLRTADVTSVAHGVPPKITQADLRAMRIPIPPRGEQRLIVATLDKYDAMLNDLSLALAAELAARRKQYEHYRDRLLTFEEAA
jgi:type I restriction enzyme S subunit